MMVIIAPFSFSQLKWVKVDSLFGILPPSVHIYKTTDSLDGKPNIAYYAEADLKDKNLQFTVDTSLGRRLTPAQFYYKGHDPNARSEVAFKFPLLVVNCTFFSYATNQSLNTVIKDGKLVGYNIHTVAGRGKDTLTYKHPFGSAIGISKKKEADIAWLYTDSSKRYAYGSQSVIEAFKDSVINHHFSFIRKKTKHRYIQSFHQLKKWKMKTAVGGGPVLLQNGEIRITNNEEVKFVGKAIDDKHPRTAMGYTKGNKLIILVIQGRFPGIAEGATLNQEARILKNIGCQEALNLDGGGSSCMLINGAETIKPSDKEGQRPVPAVFIIKAR
jgi:hypothetical protein